MPRKEKVETHPATGRLPNLDADERRTENLQIRLTPLEKEKIGAAASQARISVASWARHRLLEAAEG